ncbi:MAG: shikimate dehydrogenase [candidate division KSB1 bacterium]|nr:shikimate dehydrogenase [candidate division KSB1 bacterium]
MTDARTTLFGVIGDPIAHSLSPVMQSYFIKEFGLNAVYVAFHVKVDRLTDAVAGMRALGIAGLNVTVPHKEAVLAAVDRLSDEVRQLGAANTLKLENGTVSAHVTDPYGFIESLGEKKDRFNGARVLLLGAGGAARSVCWAAARLGVAEIILHDIDAAKSVALVERCRAFGIPRATLLSDLQVPLGQVISETPIVINATPIGMHPYDNRSPIETFSAVDRGHFFYDLVYNPAQTLFLRSAAERGAETQNGLQMLIFQGLESMRIWTGLPLHLTAFQLQELTSLLTKKLESHG